VHYGRLGFINDLKVTNRSAAGGKGALTGGLPCFLLVAWESYMIPSHTATYFFIAIRIRVKKEIFWFKEERVTYVEELLS
jgi:hypothetical protein